MWYSRVPQSPHDLHPLLGLKDRYAHPTDAPSQAQPRPSSPSAARNPTPTRPAPAARRQVHSNINTIIISITIIIIIINTIIIVTVPLIVLRMIIIIANIIIIIIIIIIHISIVIINSARDTAGTCGDPGPSTPSFPLSVGERGEGREERGEGRGESAEDIFIRFPEARLEGSALNLQAATQKLV